jgi:ABC-type dipeptide/oligopeptide/nickel transport system permease subunit
MSDHAGNADQARAAAVAGSRVGGSGRWFGRLRRNRLALVGAAGIALFLGVGLFAPLIEPYPWSQFDLAHRLSGPTPRHLFGADQFGRDLLSRMIHGARVSMLVALAATAIGTVGGVLIGAAAGYLGGWIDELTMRSMDIVLAFPQIVLAIAVAALLGPSLINVIWIVGLVMVPQFARVTRGSVIGVMNLEYVAAARTIGQSEVMIVARHILPNIVGPLSVLASLAIPGAILTEAALSFLGAGVQLPEPSWGNLMSGGNAYLLQAPWLTIFPGLALTLAVLSFNLLGDGLRDAFDVARRPAARRP